ncbi:MAG: hypothetical protein ACE5HO_20425 [bacterium]
MDRSGRLGVKKAAEGRSDHQVDLYDSVKPEWVEVNVGAVRTERVRDFGDVSVGRLTDGWRWNF